MAWTRIAAVALALSGAAAEAQTSEAAAFAGAARFTSPTLTPFANDAEFDAYVQALRNARGPRWSLTPPTGPLRFALLQTSPQVQSDAEEPCPEERPRCRESIVVTGSRISVRNASITNNQMAGVDEGDIVKQIGRFLLVLSDGRIFAIDTRPGGRPGLALADRANVYRRADVDTWYDEMLVHGDRILVTGYSYDAGHTELSVFRLGPDGRLTREGLFTRAANDYYSSSNYATRIVGDSLVIYSLFNIEETDHRDAPFGLGSMQRWVAGEPPRSDEGEDGRRNGSRAGPPLLEARSIYRPVRLETEPSIHASSICPLRPIQEGRPLECRTTAFVGPELAQWYVTADEAMIWALDYDLYGREDCSEGPLRHEEILPAVIYRVPLFSGAPTVGGGRGAPFDQFSLQVNDGRLRALVDRKPHLCFREWMTPAEPWYFEAPLSALSETYSELPQSHYAEVPNPGMRDIANRFTERHLVYGGLSQYRRGFPEIDWSEYEEDSRYLAYHRRSLSRPPAYVVPAGRPEAVRRLDVGHSVIRAERYGENDVILSGYRDRRGLSVSLIDLDGTPRIGSNLALPGRFESEGRSHAFNFTLGEDRRGTIGLPTSPRDEGRPWWRSRASDISFLSVHGDRLGRLGEIVSTLEYRRGRRSSGDEEDEDGLTGYECEVSCIDW